MVATGKIVLSSINYHVFRCFSNFPGGDYGERYFDEVSLDIHHTLYWCLLVAIECKAKVPCLPSR